MHSSMPQPVSTETSALNGCPKIESNLSTIRYNYETFDSTTTKSIPQRCSTTTDDDYYYDSRNIQQHKYNTTDTTITIYDLLQRIYCTYSKYYYLKQQQQQQQQWCDKISVSTLSSFIIIIILLVTVTLFVVITYSSSFQSSSNDDTVQFQMNNNNKYLYDLQHSYHHNESDWRWDHNVYQQHKIGSSSGMHKHNYHPNTTGFTMLEEGKDGIGDRNLLIVQIVFTVNKSNATTGIRTKNQRRALYMSTIASDLADITSRPNRAYARQWNRNFVQIQIRDEHYNNNALLYTISHFLKRIRDQQRQMLQLDDPSKRYLPYDAIAFLLPGTIIIDLDYDILQLIPIDKLISIDGINNEEFNSIDAQYIDQNDIILVNLQHPRANVLIDQWWDDHHIIDALSNHNFLHRSDSILLRDGDNALLGRLIEITKSVVANDDEELRNVIFPLKKFVGGFVLETPYNNTTSNNTDDNDQTTPTLYCVKGFSIETNETQLLLAGSIDSSLISVSDQLFTYPDVVLSTVQTVADAVCYRYYPKCEIL